MTSSVSEAAPKEIVAFWPEQKMSWCLMVCVGDVSELIQANLGTMKQEWNCQWANSQTPCPRHDQNETESRLNSHSGPRERGKSEG